ncbi:alpha/beta fold hydrolase [Actinoplanes sp. Pm04-4]|uniref:Alpha/beta fold hydrolase n=1 Tax=Paractinoplanes pyxinae TaxID=2997416 RepID=A0ABT4AUV1_9ACTN|nr:alpha/beta fold hydrolase [Actinoplanes pyxinae]MCY1137128.1 alpha/beta fold hydrolase [Actinoplanes pyxinae]
MTFVFEDLELDLGTVELRRAGVRVPMEPQTFEVLGYLVTHRERVVSKEELMDAVWGGRFVSESAVTSRIKQARQAVGDNGQAQRLIRTVHGKGYRFVGTVAAAAPVSVRHDPVRYAVSDGLHLAYQVTGGGERDIVLVPGFVSHLELDWAEPRHAAFLDRLGSMGRLIRFDKRGTGLSDRPSGVPDLETRMHDVLAVMDAAGSRRAVLFGYSEGGPMAALLAAMHPDRVEALILYGSYAKRERSADYPWAPTRAEREAYVDRLAGEWSWEADMRVMAPSADEAMARWWGQRARASATPSTVRALIAMNTLVDVRDALGSIRVPTLVLHRRGDQDSRVEEGRYLARNIPGAAFAELPGTDHFVAVDSDQILDQVAEFLAGARAAELPPLALGAVLAVRGPAPELSAVRTARTPGGTTIAVYDGPATAIRDVLGVRRREGVRFGLHIAELARTGNVVDGPGVRVAEALAERAEPGELLVSATVRDLVAASGITLERAGDDAYRPG